MIDLPRQRRCASRGFSLVEVAVVLVIIGLILAAVLQGRQLIASAEYKSFKGQLGEYRNAFYTFRDRYDALPGDMLDADASDQLGFAGGDGDGVIENGPDCTNASDESCRAWQHLRAAAMIDGNPSATGDDASPRHPYGGVVAAFFTGTAGDGVFGHKLLVADVPADVGRRLDEDVDDERCDERRVTARDTATDCTGTSDDEWSGGSGRIDIVYGLGS